MPAAHRGADQHRDSVAKCPVQETVQNVRIAFASAPASLRRLPAISTRLDSAQGCAPRTDAGDGISRCLMFWTGSGLPAARAGGTQVP
eukprot:8328155-Pyramimonas_sp.AAC.1